MAPADLGAGGVLPQWPRRLTLRPRPVTLSAKTMPSAGAGWGPQGSRDGALTPRHPAAPSPKESSICQEAAEAGLRGWAWPPPGALSFQVTHALLQDALLKRGATRCSCCPPRGLSPGGLEPPHSRSSQLCLLMLPVPFRPPPPGPHKGVGSGGALLGGGPQHTHPWARSWWEGLVVRQWAALAAGHPGPHRRAKPGLGCCSFSPTPWSQASCPRGTRA